MASPSPIPVRERPDLRLVPKNRKTKQNDTLKRQAITTAMALVLLVVVMIVLRPQQRQNVPQSGPAAMATTTDLKFSNLQLTRPSGSEVIYVDGVVTNSGRDPIKAATVELDFRDSKGKVVASVQKPVAGIAQGGAGVVRNEFMKNPIRPAEMRFFRVAVDQTPPSWNHEVPELKIVEVKAG